MKTIVDVVWVLLTAVFYPPGTVGDVHVHASKYETRRECMQMQAEVIDWALEKNLPLYAECKPIEVPKEQK